MFVVEMRAERARLPGATPVAKAMNYMLDRWPSFARFLDDGRVCITNNSSERALRGLATAVTISREIDLEVGSRSAPIVTLP